MNKPKNRAAVQLGRKGGKARKLSLSPEVRREIARKGAAARWKDHVKKGKGSL